MQEYYVNFNKKDNYGLKYFVNKLKGILTSYNICYTHFSLYIHKLYILIKNSRASYLLYQQPKFRE